MKDTTNKNLPLVLQIHHLRCKNLNMWSSGALSRVLNYLEAEVASESTENWAEGINQGPGCVILGHQFNIV